MVSDHLLPEHNYVFYLTVVSVSSRLELHFVNSCILFTSATVYLKFMSKCLNFNVSISIVSSDLKFTNPLLSSLLGPVSYIKCVNNDYGFHGCYNRFLVKQAKFLILKFDPFINSWIDSLIVMFDTTMILVKVRKHLTFKTEFCNLVAYQQHFIDLKNYKFSALKLRNQKKPGIGCKEHYKPTSFIHCVNERCHCLRLSQ